MALIELGFHKVFTSNHLDIKTLQKVLLFKDGYQILIAVGEYEYEQSTSCHSIHLKKYTILIFLVVKYISIKLGQEEMDEERYTMLILIKTKGT